MTGSTPKRLLMPKLDKGDQIEQFFAQKQENCAAVRKIINHSQGKKHPCQ
jgi:hypothetical protein